MKKSRQREECQVTCQRPNIWKCCCWSSTCYVPIYRVPCALSILSHSNPIRWENWGSEKRTEVASRCYRSSMMEPSVEPRTDQFLRPGLSLLSDTGQHHFIITYLLAQLLHRLCISWGEELSCSATFQDKPQDLAQKYLLKNEWVSGLNRMVTKINLVLRYADKKCGHEWEMGKKAYFMLL